MTNEQRIVKNWMFNFGQETPEKPCIPSLEVRKLRAKLILEEALETCHALNMHPYLKRTHYEDDILEDDSYGFWEDSKQQVDLTLIADGCADLKVVTEGTLVACGLIDNRLRKTPTLEELEKILGEGKHETIGVNPDGSISTPPHNTDPLFNEVMRSNFNKLWTDEEVLPILGIVTGPERVVAGISYKLINYTDPIKRRWLVKDKDGKVIKSPSYSSANLQSIIDEMSKL